jgi:DNA helicase-2/ATP-dependent DNA helicase PcrA
MEPQALLADLDPDQAAAVATPSRLVAVIAGAGSGKTRVLTRRIAYRVATGSADASHTLALTFTRQAAGELRRRLRRLGLRDRVEAGTFHAVALDLLRQRWADTNRPAPTVLDDRDRLVADVAGPGAVSTVATEADWMAARGLAPADYVTAARRAGRRVALAPERVAELLAAFVLLKRRRGVVDFGDLLLLLTRELAADHDFAAATRWRFRHLLVDEAQDLNPVQHRLLALLRGGGDDLFLVGDPAQAIYGFNGADATLLADVTDRLPGVEIVRLPANHRSTPEIVAAAAHVLSRSEQPVVVAAERPGGDPVEVVRVDDADAEARAVASLVAGSEPALLRTGDVAVLARTHHQLAVVERALTAQGVTVQRRAAAKGTPLDRAISSATRLPSTSRLRAWAHDALDGADDPDGETSATPDEVHVAECRVAEAALDFLREQPGGDGGALRSWIATTDPFRRGADAGGVELATFHAAKGREWHTVVAVGVETGLVPYRTASTIAARREEARLLYVALTRARERLVVTSAARRGGYARRPSPLIDGLPTGATEPAPPPVELRHVATASDRTLEALWAWRAETARATGALPEQVCPDRALAAIAATRPSTVDDLAAVSGFGPLTAARLLDPIRAALDEL